MDSQRSESSLFFIEHIAEHMPGGFFVYSALGRHELLFANRGALTIWGCESLEQLKELTENSFERMIYPDDVEAVQRSISEQIANNDGGFDHIVYRIQTRAGFVRWVDDYGHLVHTPDFGDVFYVFVADITEKRLLEEENARKNEIIEVLSNEYISILLIHLETGLVRFYRTYPSYFSLHHDACMHTGKWADVFPAYVKSFVLPEDRDLCLKELTLGHIVDRLQEESSYSFSFRQVIADGRERTMSFSVFSAGTKESSFGRVILGLRDVTDSVTRIQQDLQQKLQMQETLDRVQRTNEAKSAFLFNISHDIRTPMNSIIGYTELARRHLTEPERLADYLSKVDVSNRHMLSLIDDLLEMSQLDTGRTQIKFEVCNLTQHILSVIDMMKQKCEMKQITLLTSLEIPEHEVLIDPVRFRRVLANLLSNAVKFTPEHGEVRLKAVSRHVSKSGYARYEIEIADNGIGMSEEFLGRIFTVFEREETSTQTGYLGTGLGLAITKRLLDNMGGSIRVESVKGQGSTFTVSLPLRLASQKEDGETKSVPSVALPPGATEESLHGRRILLVEDIEFNRLLAETVLTEAGFAVESVPDGCDAVEAVEKSPEYYYDLVLMDIQMPVMNGYEATRVIRSLGRVDTDTLPIVALSANARQEDRDRSLESGMNSHIAKPFDVEHLLAIIRGHIREERPVSREYTT